MFKKLRKNEKGFTLAELLIVVAIIGVLVAISIPIFTSQLEKAREATDAANLRSAYAEVSADMLTNDNMSNVKNIPVNATQTEEQWQSNASNIGGKNVNAKTKGNNWVVSAVNNNGSWEVQIN